MIGKKQSGTQTIGTVGTVLVCDRSNWSQEIVFGFFIGFIEKQNENNKTFQSIQLL